MHERSINLTSTVLEIPDDVLRSHLRGEAAALESDTEPALLRLPETPPAYGREKIVEDLVAVTVQGNEPICINGP